jgi:tungstate transport system substrate-binding protein
MRTASVLAAICLLALAACARRDPRPLVLATTTSVVNSGLMERLAPEYLRDQGAAVRLVSVGSGRALKLLEASQADAAITHAPAQEGEALARHPDWRYRKILFNRFVVVGPRGDPARASGARDAAEAMRRIAASPARFVSRGDESGTHERERQLWSAAGAAPPRPRLVIAGASMADTLRIASETGSYTLTDEATLERLAPQLALRVVSGGDPVLLNAYAAVADASNDRGRRFVDWMAGGGGRRRIGAWLKDGSLKGFSLWPEGISATSPLDLPVDDARRP